MLRVVAHRTVEDDSRHASDDKESLVPPAKRPRLTDEIDDSLKAEQSEESRSSNKSAAAAAPKADVALEVIKIAEESNDAENGEQALGVQTTGATKRAHEVLDENIAETSKEEEPDTTVDVQKSDIAKVTDLGDLAVEN
ncbi:unnamed protein product [Ceratitis capitata]|uniref:(Mediterranean fruit fly) hypothetical protein n=1 Tax=Ceratitis capitata TaxID=7213 RepID=A0A811VJ89_CERCA|nr:unnamed protein product [Ceratitis capitata]